jgi:hypothetical protein
MGWTLRVVCSTVDAWRAVENHKISILIAEPQLGISRLFDWYWERELATCDCDVIPLVLNRDTYRPDFRNVEGTTKT